MPVQSSVTSKVVRFALGLVILFLVLLVLALGVLWLGAWTSLERNGEYSVAASQLTEFGEADAGPGVQLVRVPTAVGDFRARIAGFTGGTAPGNPKPVLLLLHGFPETSIMWQPLLRLAAQNGYRVVAFDQRGYSPDVRPTAKSAYAAAEIASDVLAVADALNIQKFHLVGHDWGAAIGWVVADRYRDRLLSWQALSIPHLAAFVQAQQTDPEQQRKSGYMAFFAMPWLPEQVFAFDQFDVLKTSLYGAHPEEHRQEYLALMREPGALTAALNWYRAGAGSGALNLQVGSLATADLPVQLIWGNQDAAVSAQAVAAHRPLMPQLYEEIELDAGHWLMQTHGELISARVLSFVERYSANSASKSSP